MVGQAMTALGLEAVRQLCSCGERGCPCQRRDGNIHCPVPSHIDENPSVSISTGHSADLVMKCFGGCTQDEVWDAVLEMTGDREIPDIRPMTEKKDERYWYTDAKGNNVFCVDRYYDSTGNKRFRQKHLVGTELVDGLNDIPRLLYNLPVITRKNKKPVFWVEGEKDVASLADIGLVATCTPQGSQSFARCLASNPQLLEPLAGKEVIIIADNDAAGRKYASDVADSLVEYASKIWTLNFGDAYPAGYDISDHIGLGYDVSDWVKSSKRLLFDSSDPEGTWNALPPYDENAIGDVTIYFRDADGLSHVEVVAMRVELWYRELRADLRISKVAKNGAVTTILPTTNINLMASNSRAGLANNLKKKSTDYNWGDIVDDVAAVLEKKTAAEVEFVDVNTWEMSNDDRNWLIEPIIGGNEHVVVYAQGGVGKSLLAGAGVLSVATGKPFIRGMIPHATSVPSLYLDWEDNEDAYVSRLRRMASGAGIDIPDNTCHYAKMTYPLGQQHDTIRRMIETKGIELVVIDSVGTAMGGDIRNSSTALRYQRLVQSLGCAVISITHVSKEDKKEGDSPDAIGSVYFMNGPRSAFFLAGDTSMDFDTKEHVLVHTKSNSGGIQKPLGYKIDYGNHTGDIKFYACSPYENIRLRKYCELIDSLEYFLEFQHKTIEELVMDLPEVKRSTIEKWLKYYKGKKFSYNEQDHTWTAM